MIIFDPETDCIESPLVHLNRRILANKSVIYCTIAPKLDFSCPAKGSTQVYSK